MSSITTMIRSRRAALNFAAGAIWHVPRSFGVASLLGPLYSLRCVLFHDVSDPDSLFTRGLGVTVTPQAFESTLKFITRHYTPVSLEDVIGASEGHGLPPRPILVTFDDAYASVVEVAAPLCAKYDVPAIFFVNGICLNNEQLALDNLICYATNVFGMGVINAAAKNAGGYCNELRSMREVFSQYLPSASLSCRSAFRRALVDLIGIYEEELAAKSGLYLSSQQLRSLQAFNFEIGNHTYSHMNCRSLSAEEFVHEIDGNRTLLEQMSGTKVRSFSVPYGSSSDLTDELSAHLQRSRYEGIFLAEGLANSSFASKLALDRVSVKADTDAAVFSEIEVLPRLRAVRNGLYSAFKQGQDRKNHRSSNAQPCAPCEVVDIQREHV